MHHLNIGDRVMVDDHPNVPESWRWTWGRVVALPNKPETEERLVLVLDVMGRPLQLSCERLVRVLHATSSDGATPFTSGLS